MSDLLLLLHEPIRHVGATVCMAPRPWFAPIPGLGPPSLVIDRLLQGLELLSQAQALRLSTILGGHTQTSVL
jgi:hypothetical protein